MPPEDGPGRADQVGAPEWTVSVGAPATSGKPVGPGDPAAVPTRPGPPTRLARRPLDQPHPDRLPTDRGVAEAALTAHRAALAAGLSGYVDPPSGLFVLTASYLAARGVCCETGCRHCPYLV